MADERYRLIVGLGNPGARYANTRHNIGFMVIDEIAEEFSIQVTRRMFSADYGKGHILGGDILLAKPQSFMNNSGSPVAGLAGYFGIPCEEILVIHDDVDLAFERIKIKSKGGHGGHKGIVSVQNALGSDTFARIRLGVGRPDSPMDVSDYVLARFSDDETKRLDPFLARARDAVITVLREGLATGMNRFNA